MGKKNDMKRAIRIGVYCVVLGVLLSAESPGQTSQPAISLEDLPPEVLAYPELILFNGKILTVDEQFSTQEALAVRGERILALGNSNSILKMAGPKTRKLDLEGQTVLPGFIDSHLHLADYAMDYMLLEEKGIRWEGRIERLGIVWKDQDMALRDVRRAVDAAAPGEWIRIPTREGNRIFQAMTLEQLDTLAPENPLVITDVSQGGRPAAVNTKAIQVAEIPPSNLPQENAVISDKTAALLAEYFTWAFPMEKVIPWHKKAMKLVNSWGLTTVVTRIKPEQFTALRAIWLQNELTVRWRVGFPGPLYIARTGNLSDIGDDWLRISGADGGLAVPGSDAALDHWSSRVPPFPDELSTWSSRRRQFLDALRYGWSIPNTHIKGNIAVREVLDVIEEARKNPVVRSPNQRLTMDHMQEIDDRDLLRIKELGVIPSSQMIDLFCDEHPEGSSRYQSVFGADDVNAMLPIRKYLELGIHPVVEADSGDKKHGSPLWGIEKLVCRCVDGSQRIWGRSQGISRQDALRMKTIWAAAYAGDSHKLGSLEAGKLADLVVLDRNYLSVPEEQISDLNVTLTLVGGKVVHSTLGHLEDN